MAFTMSILISGRAHEYAHIDRRKTTHCPYDVLVDDDCPGWIAIIYPPGATANGHDFDQGLCIPIDPSQLIIVEAWHERVRALRS
jgi:hypothetical protein